MNQKLSEFMESLDNCTHQLDEVGEEMGDQRPVGGDVQAIQQQQEDFKVKQFCLKVLSNS